MNKKYLWYIFAFFLLLIPVVLIIVNNTKRVRNNTTQKPTLSQTQAQESFRVIATIPENNAQNIYPGEILISFSTDTPIRTPNAFRLEITPSLSGYWKVTNSFPTNAVTAQVYGELLPQTNHTITIKDAKNTTIHTWSFMTSATPASSSSNIVIDRDNDLLKTYYPLHASIPYETRTFSLDYTTRLTLEVIVKSGEPEQVKQEVLTWIRSKEVDPRTHTINYVTQ